MQKTNRNRCRRFAASFTVESSFIIPLMILVFVLGLHIAYELQDSNIQEAQKPPAVEALEPVEEKWHED